MARERGFSQRLWRWLERLGFTDDPFALYEADQERPYLHYFFVDRPYLHDVLGDPSWPQAAFLMAGQGAGKTATREMVAYECNHARLRRRALAVRYYDFSPLLDQVRGNLDLIEARHHVRTLARHTLQALVDDVPPTYFDLLTDMERGLLAGCAAEFAAPITQLKLGQVVPDAPIQLDWGALSPLETIKTLADLITSLGQSPQARYEAVYILVDRVDESAAGPQAAVPLLKPLVSESPLLQMAHVAFKFFLPIQVGAQLQQVVSLRPDRLCVQTITWDEDALRRMVEQRLSYYSEGRIERLEELCTSGAKASAMDRLIRACQGSPRTLLRLCKALIHHHVAKADETSPLITYTELVETLHNFEYQLEAERSQLSPAVVAQASPQPVATPPEQGLYLDEKGHVWIDGEPLTPPLSKLEFRLLQTLYRQTPEIVPHEALIEAVWPESAWMSGQDEREPSPMDEQNLRKLVGRLRQRLPGKRSRYVKNVRGRGYWLKLG